MASDSGRGRYRTIANHSEAPRAMTARTRSSPPIRTCSAGVRRRYWRAAVCTPCGPPPAWAGTNPTRLGPLLSMIVDFVNDDRLTLGLY